MKLCLRQKLLSNGYKRNYVERIFKKTIDKFYSVQTNKKDEKLKIEDTENRKIEKLKLNITLPFI